MKVAVIGAGIIGITTAYELALDGHEVTVFERRGAAAEETSFANAGVVAPGYVTPWAAPGMPAKVFRHLLSRHAPVKIGLPLSGSDVAWMWKWWRACKPEPYAVNRARMQRLAFYSKERLHGITETLQLEYDRSPGYTVLLRSEKDSRLIQPGLQVLRDAGVAFREIGADEVRQIEPAINTDTRFFGGVHLAQDGVGNCRQFALLLKNEAQSLGVNFRFNTAVERMDVAQPATLLIAGETQPQRFDGVVLCAGLASARLLAPLGLKIPLAAVYGYSISAPIREPLNAPRSGLMDERYKVAISRMGNRVRVAGSAEIGGSLDNKRASSIQTLYKVLHDWFPGAAQLSNTGAAVQEWKGARPMLPDGPPIIGPSGLPGLWLNLGHGSSGWALACGSAKVLTDMVAYRQPEIDTSGLDVGGCTSDLVSNGILTATMQRITSATGFALHGITATREVEQRAAAQLPPHVLMQRAGRAVARLALAIAPHARHVWIACGPGNNGGDGFEAGLHLHQAGKTVTLTWTGHPDGEAGLPADARASLARARAAGLELSSNPPPSFDLAIDALLGLGGHFSSDRRPNHVTAPMLAWLSLLRSSASPVLAVDNPSGLDVETGQDTVPTDAIDLIADGARPITPAARFTLSLLTLKPGLFTAAGRDLAGQVWLDDLGAGACTDVPATAQLLGADQALTGHGGQAKNTSPHASHKGSFGDVAVIGGETTATASMAGAALLAARAALHGGAGRVMVALLGEARLFVDTTQPELMFRSADLLDYRQQVMVCGCGGGELVRQVLPKVLSAASRAVLDADALNAIAADVSLQTLLAARHGRGYQTVITPHPLEAARLLGGNTAQVQAGRLAAATALAGRFSCVVVLKGSGTVIASPARVPAINPTGNALLATAGTGDVLAGMVGAALARGSGALEAACSAVFTHGRLADDWADNHPGEPLTASALARQGRH